MEIQWDNLEEAVPAFFASIFMGLSYSISYGIAAGFITYILVKLVNKTSREIQPAMWVSAALFLINFIAMAKM